MNTLTAPLRQRYPAWRYQLRARASCLFGAMALAGQTALHPKADLWVDPAAARHECLAGDLLADHGSLAPLTVELSPGYYQATFHLRISRTVDRYLARQMFRIAVRQGDHELAAREFSVVAFERAGQYQPFVLSFAAAAGGTVSLHASYEWQGMRGAKRPYPTDTVAMSTSALMGADVDGDPDLVLERHLQDLPWHLALDRVDLTAAREVVVQSLEVGKVRYRPGDTAEVRLELANFGVATQRVTAVVEVIRALDEVEASKRLALELSPGTLTPLTVELPLSEARWGREVRVRLVADDGELHRAAEYFTVHDNPWAVAIGAYGLQLANYRAGPDYRNCEPMARRTRRAYGNMIEFVFWAPDDFGGLTPTADEYWCGQLHHPGGAEATRQLIAAYHRHGIACSFYARIKVACGKEGFELFRQHPDWFRPGFYDVSHLDRWDRSATLTSWPRLGVRGDVGAPYQHHAEEIVRSVREFGWDAVRYDSAMETRELDGVAYPVARYFPAVKRTVNAALPDFGWGYNDGLHRRDLEAEPELKQLFATLCDGGGMIMDEYNNHAFQDRWTYDKYARRHRHIRDQVQPLGGHFTLCPFDLDWVSDQIYQGILPLVARGHQAWDPHKGGVPYADYNQFSTRYAGEIWDPAAVVVPGAAERIDLGAATDSLFHPHEYSYWRPLDDDRSQLIMHLVNRPPERACSYDDNRVSPPLLNLQAAIALPVGASVQGVFAASAEPRLYQEPLDFDVAGDRLTFTVPKVRFWTMVVVQVRGTMAWQ